MHVSDEMKNRTRQSKSKLVKNLIINLIIPWALYTILRRALVSDTTSLAITVAIPAVRTLFTWVYHRKINYIGMLSFISLIIALIATAFSGGNPLPLKLVHPMIFGVFGIVCIISVLIGKPLLMTIFQLISHGKENRFSGPEGRKKSTIMTAMFGVISLVNSIVHICMALLLQTGTFVAMSNMVSWITILVLIGSAKLVVSKIK